LGVVAIQAETNLLDLVYEAAVDPGSWPAVLEGYADAVGGAVASILIQDQVTGKGDALQVRQDPANLPLLFGYYANRNPLLRITDLPVRLRVMTDEEKLPKNELMRTEYYNDYLRPKGWHSILMARLAVDGRNTVVLNVGRPEQRESFGAPEIETADRLQPHLIRAVRLASRFAGMQGLDGGLKAVVDQSPHGAFLLDCTGKLRYANRAGEALLAGNRGFSLRNGTLHAATAGGTRRLHALIAAAASGEDRQSGTVALPRPNYSRPLSAIVSPLRSERLCIFSDGPSVLVSVGDPDAAIAVPEQRIRDLFGLSRAEARVALQVLEGRDPREAARQLGLSFYTVRAHLVRIFDKTGTKRQAELVRLLIRTTGAFSG
jgi:DNA-binding CsgD family transcriptional regulator